MSRKNRRQDWRRVPWAHADKAKGPWPVGPFVVTRPGRQHRYMSRDILNNFVVRDQGQWKITQNGVPHSGPYATQRDAICAAVDAANEAGHRALTLKSCSGINSEPSGLTEKTRIRRIVQITSKVLVGEAKAQLMEIADRCGGPCDDYEL